MDNKQTKDKSDSTWYDSEAKNYVLTELKKLELIDTGNYSSVHGKRRLDEKVIFSGNTKYTNEILHKLNNILDDANSIKNREKKLICIIGILKMLIDNIGTPGDDYFQIKLNDYNRELYEIQIKNTVRAELLQSIVEKI